jgi:hypothetical protein
MSRRKPMDTRVTSLKIVSLAMITDSPAYLLIMYLMRKGIIPLKPEMQFSNGFYLLLIPCVFLFLGAGKIAEFLWQARKEKIYSPDGFYSVLLTLTMVTLSTIELIGVTGLIVFVLTGNLNFALLLLGVSFVGKLLHFPNRAFIEEKLRECPKVKGAQALE